MLKSSNKVETNVYELQISIDAETFENAIQKAYFKQKNKITLPGFRKGKAPRHMIERMYGEGVFYEDALEIAYPDAVEDAIKEAGLEIVDTPHDLDVIEMGKNGVEMKLKVTVKPEVKLGKYKGLKATKMSTKVSADEVKAELTRLQEQNSRMISVDDRPAKKGDTAVIDFEGFVDGVAFKGGKGENHNLELGSGSFIPGFEDQVIGHNIDEEFDVNVIFPDDYHAEELKGKEAVFKVKIHDIRLKEIPALDDEFAKDVSEFDTIDELKKDIKSHLEGHKKEDADAQLANDLIGEVADNIKAEIPQVMFDNEAENMVNDFAYNLQAQGLDIQTYMKYTGTDKDVLKEQYMETATKQVKVQLAIEAIIAAEKIEASEDEINEEYEKVAKQYGLDVEEVKKVLNEEHVASTVKSRKAVEFVKDNAVITEEKAPAKKTADKVADEKAPAKKTATKKPAAKKDDVQKAPAKKPAAKKTASTDKKPAAKKPAAKKTDK